MENSTTVRPTDTPAQPAVTKALKMKALSWHGKKNVRIDDVPRPLVTDPRDIVLKITATTICGSDLHLYSGNFPEMKDGDILGHEFMGIVDDVGSAVKKLKRGQRVVVAFNIACGSCEFCKREEFSACKRTNPSVKQKEMMGVGTGALFGYSHLTGGVPGGQAEYVRVPFADVNCLPIPDAVPDEKALYLSDIVPTSLFGIQLAEVKEGDTVAIWGLGPVGLCAARWAQVYKAAKVIGIDCVKERLDLARTRLGIDTINFKEADTVKTLLEMFPDGVDCAVEAAGFEYPTTALHKFELATGLETDTADIFKEMFMATRPFGHVAVLGVYVNQANHFPVGMLMEKGLTVRCGQSPTQRNWKYCLDMIQSGEFDPTFVVTHRGSLNDAPDLYKKFYNREGGVIKVFLRPQTAANTAQTY